MPVLIDFNASYFIISEGKNFLESNQELMSFKKFLMLSDDHSKQQDEKL